MLSKAVSPEQLQLGAARHFYEEVVVACKLAHVSKAACFGAGAEV